MPRLCRNNCFDKGLSGRQLVCRTIVGQRSLSTASLLSAFFEALGHLSQIHIPHRLAFTEIQLEMPWNGIENSIIATSCQIWSCITDIDVRLEVRGPTLPFPNHLVLKHFTQGLMNLQKLSLSYSDDHY